MLIFIIRICYLVIFFSIASQVMTRQLPRSQIVNENSNIDLTCESDGWPRAEFKWYKGSVELSDDGIKYSIQDSEVYVDGIIRVKSVMTIYNVDRKEADKYLCKAESVVNSAESSTDLIVNCKYITTTL